MTDIKRATKVLIEDNGENYIAYSLQKLSAETGKSITHLPYSIRVLLENQLRNFDDDKVHGADIGDKYSRGCKNDIIIII